MTQESLKTIVDSCPGERGYFDELCKRMNEQ